MEQNNKLRREEATMSYKAAKTPEYKNLMFFWYCNTNIL